MNNNNNQIFSAEKVIEKELKKHPERDRMKTVKMAAEKERKIIIIQMNSQQLE